MNLWSFLFGDGTGKAIATPIEALGNAIDQVTTSDDERNAAAIVMQRLAQAPHILQGEVNKLEAQHRSTFVAGWRPAIGWVCAASLAAYFIPQYVVAAWVWAKLVYAQCIEPVGAVCQTLPRFPAEADGLFELVLALLGLGTLRTVEKVKGRAK